MVEIKPYRYPEVIESKNLTERNKGQASKYKRYRGKNMQNKTQGTELEEETEFKRRCSYLEGYIFDIGPRSLDKFDRAMK